MATWEVWLDDPTGTRLKLADELISGTAAKVANNPGACRLVLPEAYDPYIRLDGMIEVWRRPEGGALKLWNVYFMRSWEYADADGKDITGVGGPDGLSIIEKRIVAYDAGTTFSEAVAEPADNLLKRLVTENCATGATDTDRDLSGLGVTIAPNAATANNAPDVTIGFARRNMLDLFLDVAEASRKSGTNLYYDFVPVPASDGSMGFDFRTYTDQPGADRTGDDAVYFGREWGNLRNASIEIDHRDEITVVYAGGRGTEDDRVVEEVEDTTRSGASPWNRVEKFYNAAGQNSTTDAYVAAGNAVLSDNRPRLRVTGEIIDTEQARFGVDWNWGDRVVVTYRGYQWDAVITGIVLTMNGGRESIRATFEVQT